MFVQGSRPGGLAALRFRPQAVAARRPGVVCVSLSANGETGPWRDRRGFDSLVQTATSFNHFEAEAAGSPDPKSFPMQILDYATGHLMAFAASAALRRQALQGGSWQVRLSLAQTGHWIRNLGRIENGFAVARPCRAQYLETAASGLGELVALRHGAQPERTPARWKRPSMPPGTHPPIWP